MEKQEQRVYHTKIDSSGRILLSAESRQRQHLESGDTVVVVEDDAGLHVKSMEQALREAQTYFAGLAPADVILSAELLADRRSEGERD
jgi:hypothetical protein